MKTAVYVHRRQNIKAQKVPDHVRCVCRGSDSQSWEHKDPQSDGSRERQQQRLSALSFFVDSGPQSRRLATMVDWAVLAAPVLLPVSFLWDSFCFFRLWINYWLAQPEKQHSAKVFAVQAQVTSCLLPPESL